jgi:DNA-binding CsgD family transcriptional regulator
VTDPGSSFDALVESVYAAAGDAPAWSAFIQRYVEVAGCEAACLFHAPLRQTSARIEVAAGIDPAMIHAFDQYYSRINPYGPALAQRSAGDVVTLGALVPGSEERSSEFYNDYVVPQRHHIAPTFAQVLAGRDVTSTLGLFSTSPKKGELERVIAFQKRFVGHLQCALRLHAQIVDLKAQVNDLLTALDYRGIAVLSVDGGARVVSMSRCAATILARNDGLAYRGGAFEARSARPVSLARALETVTGVGRGGQRRSPPFLRVARNGHASNYELLLCPVPEHQPELRARGARALVFIFDPSVPPVLNAELLFQSHGLTKSEARVVQLLASGETPPDIARRLSVSRETIKSHLSAAYAKTGTRGQSELVATVLTGVGIMPNPPAGSPGGR